jgi:hypothetical protein
MKTFTIDGDNNITVFGSLEEAASAITENTQQFTTQKDLAKLASAWPVERLVEVWNGLPGGKPVKKFANRKAAVAQIWKAVQGLGATVAAPVATPRRVKSPKAKKAAQKDKPATARDESKSTAARVRQLVTCIPREHSRPIASHVPIEIISRTQRIP